jgi:adenylate cyclase class 2
MLEVEMKFRLADWATVVAKLTEWGATPDPVRKDTDSYFNAPDRDFAQTDEAVRVRRVGNVTVLTYKGPKIDTATKTRTEIELPLADGPSSAADAVRFLSALGYRPVAVVTKHRTVYHFTRHGFPVHACFDDVGAVGRYVEIEVMAEPAQLDAAKAAVMTTATELGLTDHERRSYLRLLLEK